MLLLKIIILRPISWVYACVVWIRNYFYDIGFFATKTFAIPTICVGNLSVGGTGKTPMIELLITLLKDQYKVAVLSRGYGRKSKGYLKASANSSVEDLGDEPFQIYAKFPKINLVVDADRCNAISKVEKELDSEIVLLDDAFQHRKVTPSFSILLTAYDKLYKEDFYLPYGELRDHKNQDKRASVIVVTKCPKDLSVEQRKLVIDKLNPKKHQQVLFSFLTYEASLKGMDSSIALSDLKSRKITLVTGIANPKPLVSYLNEQHISFEHLAYRDHYFFNDEQLKLFNSKEIILTTEKDFVRLKGAVKNVYAIAIKHQFFDDGKALLEKELSLLMKQKN